MEPLPGSCLANIALALGNDPHRLGSLMLTCRRLYRRLRYKSDTIWQQLSREVWEDLRAVTVARSVSAHWKAASTSDKLEDGVASILLPSYGDWFAVYTERPRLRTDGIYFMHRVKSGQGNSYYRYLAYLKRSGEAGGKRVLVFSSTMPPVEVAAELKNYATHRGSALEGALGKAVSAKYSMASVNKGNEARVCFRISNGRQLDNNGGVSFTMTLRRRRSEATVKCVVKGVPGLTERSVRVDQYCFMPFHRRSSPLPSVDIFA